jgi:DNA-directed RNA polymerase omega subunit
MERFTIDRLLKVKPNKYEVLVIAGVRAREIAQEIREGKIPEHVKPTIRALEDILKDVEGGDEPDTQETVDESEDET